MREKGYVDKTSLLRRVNDTLKEYDISVDDETVAGKGDWQIAVYGPPQIVADVKTILKRNGIGADLYHCPHNRGISILIQQIRLDLLIFHPSVRSGISRIKEEEKLAAQGRNTRYLVPPTLEAMLLRYGTSMSVAKEIIKEEEARFERELIDFIRKNP